MTEVPGTIVFDAEPLVAYWCDESGSDTVEAYVEAVEGTANGYISAVTRTELHYVVRAIDGAARADAAIEILDESGIRTVDATATWSAAADFKYHHALPLGDAFALGTALHVDGTLLVGGDADYESIETVPIERFRTDAG